MQRKAALRLSASDLLKHEFIIDTTIAGAISVRRKSFGSDGSGAGELQRTNTINRIISQGEKIFRE